jgi:hypothetical protein
MDGLGLNEDIFAGMCTGSKKKPHSSHSNPADNDDFNGDNDDACGNPIKGLGIT